MNQKVRDPWFPIAMLLCVLLCAWLGIFGELQAPVAEWIKAWQTLIGATVASIAATVAVWNTTRSLSAAERLETQRRRQRQAAIRAMLPLALSQIVEYAGKSARRLEELLEESSSENFDPDVACRAVLEELPSAALDTLAEFIEFTDEGDLRLIASTIAWIQVHSARVRGLVDNRVDFYLISPINAYSIRSSIIDAASIAAGASAYFDYARRRASFLPGPVKWASVVAALHEMKFWETDAPEIFEIIQRREKIWPGPFDPLS